MVFASACPPKTGAKCLRAAAPRAENASPSVTNKLARKHDLPKREILRGDKLFYELFESGQFKRGKFFNVVWRAAERRRVAFATARRIKSAVTRNSIKRRLREAYRLEKHEFTGRAEVVFIGGEKVIMASFAALRADMRRLGTIIPEKSVQR